ncbi:nucleotide-diphospho-sugar transferase [Obelidium mucronatum]|nr:nucleotide-diphospho-sugar transferase [Obelidium mucronatum]
MDFGGLATTREFQAVILAGSGAKLFPLIDEKCPKAMLPLANKPMLFYQLEWLETAMINDIMIVCQEEAHKKINSYIHNVLNVSERYPNSKVEVIKAKGSGSASADALRHVANRIKTDFIVMSCDTITNYPPNKLLDVFRIQSPTFTALFHEPLKPEGEAAAKIKDDDLIEYVGIDHSTCRLLFAVAGDEMDDELPVRMSILDKFPVVNIHTKLRDAHLYVFKHWVIDFLAKSKIQSIKEELIPLLTHFQYSEKVLKREGVEKYLMAPSNFDQFYTSRHQSSTGGGFVNATRSESMNKFYKGELKESEVDDPSTDFHKHIVCTALVAKEGFCFRVNSVPNYLEGSRTLIKTINAEDLVPRSVERGKGCQVGDSLVGDSCRVGEKTSIKKSVIGNHCVIGKNVKIINSVLMDHTVVEDKAVLEGTVVCSNSKVLELCNLRDCQIASGVTLEREVQGKGEAYIE